MIEGLYFFLVKMWNEIFLIVCCVLFCYVGFYDVYVFFVDDDKNVFIDNVIFELVVYGKKIIIF